MSTELEAALAAVIRRLGSIAVTNPELIAELRQLAQQFLKLTEPPVEEPGPAEPVAEAASTQAGEVPAQPAAPAVPPPRHEPLPTVPGVEVPVGWAQRVGVSDADLQLIENRCRLKAEGARWAATRQRRINDGADYYLEIEPADRDIIARAKALEDCFTLSEKRKVSRDNVLSVAGVDYEVPRGHARTLVIVWRRLECRC